MDRVSKAERELVRKIQKQTNYDRIISKTPEELADELLTAFAAFYDVEWSKEAVLDWLKEEVKEGET